MAGYTDTGQPTFKDAFRSNLPLDQWLAQQPLHRSYSGPSGKACSQQSQCKSYIVENRDDFPSNPNSDATVGDLPPLLLLPKEVRDKIYSYALAYDKPIAIRKYSTVEFPKLGSVDRQCIERTSWRFSPGLLRVSRAIEVDAAPSFYGNNTFATRIIDGNITELLEWLTEIPSTYLMHTRTLKLIIQPVSAPDLLEMVARSTPENIHNRAVALVDAMNKATIPVDVVEVITPCMRHLYKDCVMMGLQADQAERVRAKWMKKLERELDRIETERQLVEGFDRLAVESGNDSNFSGSVEPGGMI